MPKKQRQHYKSKKHYYESESDSDEEESNMSVDEIKKLMKPHHRTSGKSYVTMELKDMDEDTKLSPEDIRIALKETMTGLKFFCAVNLKVGGGKERGFFIYLCDVSMLEDAFKFLKLKLEKTTWAELLKNDFVDGEEVQVTRVVVDKDGDAIDEESGTGEAYIKTIDKLL